MYRSVRNENDMGGGERIEIAFEPRPARQRSGRRPCERRCSERGRIGARRRRVIGLGGAQDAIDRADPSPDRHCLDRDVVQPDV